MNYSFKIKNKNHCFAKVFLITVSIIGLILFILTSFLDRETMKIFVKLFQFKFIKLTVLATYKLGNYLIIGFIVPICLLSLADWIIVKFQLKYLMRNKIIFLKLLFWIYLSISLLILLISPIKNLISYPWNLPKSKISIEKIDIKYLTDKITSSVYDIVLIVFIFVFNCFLFIYFLNKSINDNGLMKNNYIKPSITIIIFIIYCYFVIMILKHISGRPLYTSVAWTRENSIKYGLDPNYSIEAFFEKNGWKDIFNKNGIGEYKEAIYHEWWQPNNIFKNWINWFTIPENVWVDYNDSYWSMDFPSGHIVSYSNWFAIVYFFYFSNSYKKNNKFNILQKITIFIIAFIFVICAFGLIIQMFHWPTDVSFSIAFTPIMFYFSIITFKKWDKNFLYLKNKLIK